MCFKNLQAENLFRSGDAEDAGQVKHFLSEFYRHKYHSTRANNFIGAYSWDLSLLMLVCHYIINCSDTKLHF